MDLPGITVSPATGFARPEAHPHQAGEVGGRIQAKVQVPVGCDRERKEKERLKLERVLEVGMGSPSSASFPPAMVFGHGSKEQVGPISLEFSLSNVQVLFMKRVKNFGGSSRTK